MNYGTYIKIYRILNDISAPELCSGICTISTLSKIENQKNNISPDIVNQILKKLNGTNIDILEENSKKIAPLVNSFYQKLELNLDKEDLIKEITTNKKLFLNSYYILFSFVSQAYKNYDLFKLNNTHIDIPKKLESIYLLGDEKDKYYLSLILAIKCSDSTKRLDILKEKLKDESIGWSTYYYADFLFHENRLKESIQTAQTCYGIACKNCNIHLMYGSLLLLGLCSLNNDEENSSTDALNYFKKLNNLSPFIQYDIESIINYNIGSTLLEQSKIQEAELYLTRLENKHYEYTFESFNIIHKLAYYYVETKDKTSANKYINWLTEYSKIQTPKNQVILNKLIESLRIKLEAQNYIDNKIYQENIEYIFKNASKYISLELKHFYFHDIENVYLNQRRYKDLYYLYSKKDNH